MIRNRSRRTHCLELVCAFTINQVHHTDRILHPHVKAAKSQGRALACTSATWIVVGLFVHVVSGNMCTSSRQSEHLCHEDSDEAVIVGGF